MGKKITGKSHRKEVSDSSDSQMKPSGRHDNSLSLLTRRFTELLKNSPQGTVDLNTAYVGLQVQKRRIYDITNVLEGINYVQKLQKNVIKWVGGQHSDRPLQEIQRELDSLANEEQELDAELDRLKQKQLEIQGQNRLYVTSQDCRKVFKALQNGEEQKMVIFCQLRGRGRDPLQNIYICDNKGMRLYS